MSNVQKPPTRSVGVAGFKADLYACDVKKTDWQTLVHLPKFQTYAVEVAGRQYGHVGNVMEWVVGYVQDCIQSYGERNFFDDFVKWDNGTNKIFKV